MPKITSCPLLFQVFSHGRSPINLADYINGEKEFPDRRVFRFLSRSRSIFVAPTGAHSEFDVFCDDCQTVFDAIEERQPLCLSDPETYLFGRRVWQISKTEQSYTKEQLRLVFLDFVDKERQKWESLKRRFSGVAGDDVEYERKPISEDVRMYVWRRDQGRCVQCGSVEKLEFDHLIPVSKGGSNTARNIQLLCEACNRVKSAKI